MAFGGETADSYYDEGVTASMRGDVAQAVRHFKKALQLDPYHVSSCHQLGKCRVRQGKLQDAVECFYRAIKARPNPIPPHIDLGNTLLEGGNVPRAESVFNEVLQRKPGHGKALLGLAACAFAKGEWDQAYIMVKEVVDQGGAGFPVFYLQGRSARLAGLQDVAAEAFETADGLIENLIDGNPEQPEGYYLRGELNFARENFAVALDSYQAAEDRMDSEGHYYSYGEHFDQTAALGKRAMCYYRLGKADDARALAEKLLEQDPENKIGKMLTREG